MVLALLQLYLLMVGLCISLATVLIKWHKTIGLCRRLAVLQYVMVIGLRAWVSLNMSGIVYGNLQKKGTGKDLQAMGQCMEPGWIMGVVA